MKLLDYWGNPIRKDAYIIRATEFGQFINCPRNWAFGTHNGLNLEPVYKSPKLRFGTIWHEGMEAIYNPQASKDPFTAISDCFSEERQIFEDVLGVEAYDPELTKQLSEEETLANQLMTAYEDWRNTLADPRDSDLNFVGAEHRYVIPLDGTRAYVAVKFDAEALDRNSGFWIMEHKTRGKSSDVGNPPELELDFQMGIQLLVASYVHDNVRGVLYNLARKQPPGPRVKKDIFGRHKAQRTPYMLKYLESYVLMVYRDMREASRLLQGPEWEYGIRRLRYNPQPMGFCRWGCAVKEICEAINRGEDYEYLVREKLTPREKNIWETLEEELQEQ